MNKKIFAVLSIFLMLMVGCAYAADSTDANNNTVTISGVNFTIPDGFTEDVAEAVVNESNSDDGYNYITNQKMFEDANDNLILISVETFEENITDDYISDFGENATFNNISGSLEDLGFLALFTYVQDGQLVVITANNQDLIEEVLS